MKWNRNFAKPCPISNIKVSWCFSFAILKSHKTHWNTKKYDLNIIYRFLLTKRHILNES